MPTVLPPGTILQLEYVRERVRRWRPGTFVEVGVGRGVLTRLLLEYGWRGVGYDSSSTATTAASALNSAAIAAGHLEIKNEDWLHSEGDPAVDLVISSMVIEHLDASAERRYFEHAREILTGTGRLVLLVPASPRHWGIEDDIAGHLRRYTREGLRGRLDELGWRLDHVAGLTYPISNLLLPLSNRLVERAEGDLRSLAAGERTLRSGVRTVPLKTTFPTAVGLVLNRFTLFPLHLLQKAKTDHPNALVLYAEATPAA